MKTVIMPTYEQIVERLKSVLDVGSDIARVYDRFALMVATQEKNEAGVMMAMQLAIADVSGQPGAVPFLSGMINSYYEDYMRALFPDDAEFVQACNDWYNKVSNSVL